jgi:N-acetylmuramoyl-L-alanine amidase
MPARSPMTYSIKHHVLHLDGAPVAQRATPNRGGRMVPHFLVMHFTGSSSTSSAVGWLTDARAKASAHLVISPEGAVTQLAPFNVVTWHAGRSSYQGREGFNSFSIGIELVNAGMLAKRADGVFIERISPKVVPADQVILARHKNGGPEVPWAIYPQAQIEAAILIGQALNQTYRFIEVVGHDEIAPGRKSDPGAAFPMGRVESLIMGRR